MHNMLAPVSIHLLQIRQLVSQFLHHKFDVSRGKKGAHSSLFFYSNIYHKISDKHFEHLSQ